MHFINIHASLRLLTVSTILFIEFARAQQGAYDWQEASILYPGVRHAQMRVETPRPMDIHCVQVDTTTPGLSFFTTGRAETWVENDTETLRQTTRGFLREARQSGRKMVVAINADAFSPWPVPWNQQSLTNLLGLAVSDANLVSPGNNTPSFIVDNAANVTMAVTTSATPVSQIHTAVSGFGFCLTNGNPLAPGGTLAPRTGIGLSEDGRFAFLMVIDGRRHASQGSTIPEVGEWLKYFGAHNGINMDGGGSTTLARWDLQPDVSDPALLLNNPVGSGVNWLETFTPEFEAQFYQPTERNNGSNLGVVVPHLAFIRQPLSASVLEGDCYIFEVEAVNTFGDVSYVWMKDGEVIPDAENASTLVLCPVAAGDGGTYTCQVSDTYITLTSLPGHLFVEQKMPVHFRVILMTLFVAGISGVRLSRKYRQQV